MKTSASINENIYKYQIDEYDKIKCVSENWDKFAAENDALDLVSKPQVLNRPLWDFITDIETRHLYSIVIDRVRKENVPVDIPFRCDSPNLRRFMKMTIKPLSDNKVRFKSEIMRVEKREPLKILDKNETRSNENIEMCSFCKKIKMAKNKWGDTEDAIQILHLFDYAKPPQITHGLCPECYQAVLAELN